MDAYRNATEAVGVFDSETALEEAVDALETHGFDRADIGLMASAETVERRLGHVYRSVRAVEDEPRVPTTAYVSREARGDAEGALVGALIYLPAVAGSAAVVASGGALAAAIAAAAVAGGIGGGVGALLAGLLGRHHAEAVAAALERGGLVLYVRTRDDAHESAAVDILTKAGARDVHLHTIPSLAADDAPTKTG